MGMFMERLLESAIQDPNDPGNDLDQIAADAVENPDVEEAESGVIGDSLSESAAMIMYESTYNYNQLMRCIGITELREAARGYDFVLEAVDIRAFFDKVKTILTNMFRAVTRAFKNVLNKMVTAVTSDKKLATDHASAIKAGYASDEWSYKGYKFGEGAITYNCKSCLDKMKNGCKNALDALKKDGSYDEEAVEKATSHANIIKENAGVTAEDVSGLREALHDLYFGGKEKINFGKGGEKYPGGAEGVIKLLSADKETKAIKESYKKIKDDYKEAIKAIDSYKNAVSAKDYEGNISKALSICSKFNEATIFEKNVQNTVYSMCLTAAKAKRSQARRLALLWQRLGTKKDLNKKYAKIQHNSASLFGGIDLV